MAIHDEVRNTLEHNDKVYSPIFVSFTYCPSLETPSSTIWCVSSISSTVLCSHEVGGGGWDDLMNCIMLLEPSG